MIKIEIVLIGAFLCSSLIDESHQELPNILPPSAGFDLRRVNHPPVWTDATPVPPQPCNLDAASSDENSAPATVTTYLAPSQRTYGLVSILLDVQILTYYGWDCYMYNKTLQEMVGEMSSLNSDQMNEFKKLKKMIISMNPKVGLNLRFDITSKEADGGYSRKVEQWRKEVVFKVVDTQWSIRGFLISPAYKEDCHPRLSCNLTPASQLHHLDAPESRGLACDLRVKGTQVGIFVGSVKNGETIRFLSHNGYHDYTYPATMLPECMANDQLIYVTKEGALTSFSLDKAYHPLYLLSTRTPDLEEYKTWLDKHLASWDSVYNASSVRIPSRLRRSTYSVGGNTVNGDPMKPVYLLNSVPQNDQPKWIHDYAVSGYTSTAHDLNLLANLTLSDILALRQASCLTKYNMLLMAYLFSHVTPSPWLSLTLGHRGFLFQQDDSRVLISIGRPLHETTSWNLTGDVYAKGIGVLLDGEKCIMRDNTGLIECGHQEELSSRIVQSFHIPRHGGGSLEIISNQTMGLDFIMKVSVGKFLTRASSSMAEMVDYSHPEILEMEQGMIQNEMIAAKMGDVHDNFDRLITGLRSSTRWISYLKWAAVGLAGIWLIPLIPVKPVMDRIYELVPGRKW